MINSSESATRMAIKSHAKNAIIKTIKRKSREITEYEFRSHTNWKQQTCSSVLLKIFGLDSLAVNFFVSLLRCVSVLIYICCINCCFLWKLSSCMVCFIVAWYFYRLICFWFFPCHRPAETLKLNEDGIFMVIADLLAVKSKEANLFNNSSNRSQIESITNFQWLKINSAIDWTVLDLNLGSAS